MDVVHSVYVPYLPKLCGNLFMTFYTVLVDTPDLSTVREFLLTQGSYNMKPLI